MKTYQGTRTPGDQRLGDRRSTGGQAPGAQPRDPRSTGGPKPSQN